VRAGGSHHTGLFAKNPQCERSHVLYCITWVLHMDGNEFKSLLVEFNLSYDQASKIVGASKSALAMAVSRGGKSLTAWGNVIRDVHGAAPDLGKTVHIPVHISEEPVHISADVNENVNGGPQNVNGPSHNVNGSLVAQLPGLAVVRPSAESGHPEWDIMSDGLARGYRFVRGGVPEDDDQEMRRRYRTPAAIRRILERRGDFSQGIWQESIRVWEETGALPK